MPGNEAVEIVPPAHISAWSGKPDALAIDLEQTIVRQRKVMRMKRVVLLGEQPTGELNVRVVELSQRLARFGHGNGSKRRSGGKRSGGFYERPAAQLHRIASQERTREGAGPSVGLTAEFTNWRRSSFILAAE